MVVRLHTHIYSLSLASKKPIICYNLHLVEGGGVVLVRSYNIRIRPKKFPLIVMITVEMLVIYSLLLIFHGRISKRVLVSESSGILLFQIQNRKDILTC